jgi:hypothetical protein
MLMSLFMTLTLVAQNEPSDNNERCVQSFAERLKASHELKKPSALEDDDDDNDNNNKNIHGARPFQVRMTQTVARRR